MSPELVVLMQVSGGNFPTGPCGCECSRGGFCGGCGHAGCGGRR